MNHKNPLQADINRATRKFTDCLRCHKPLSGRQEAFCSNACRWNFHNQARRLARRMLIEREIEHLQLEGYEVKKKGE